MTDARSGDDTRDVTLAVDALEVAEQQAAEVDARCDAGSADLLRVERLAELLDEPLPEAPRGLMQALVFAEAGLDLEDFVHVADEEIDELRVEVLATARL